MDESSRYLSQIVYCQSTNIPKRQEELEWDVHRFVCMQCNASHDRTTQACLLSLSELNETKPTTT